MLYQPTSSQEFRRAWSKKKKKKKTLEEEHGHLEAIKNKGKWNSINNNGKKIVLGRWYNPHW